MVIFRGQPLSKRRYFPSKMFAKAKPRYPSVNTQKKFKAQQDEQLLYNRFETASGIIRKHGSQLKQTKLCKTDNKLKFGGFVTEETVKARPQHEFVFKPVSAKLQPRPGNETFYGAPLVTIVSEPPAALPPLLLTKPGRNLISLIGRVDFALKTHKLQPDLNVIWNIYGKLLRIIVGKNQEHTLLLRNGNHGPILQSIFFDFDDELKALTNGCFVHVVGRFIGDNRLQTFKVKQVSIEVWQQNFVRLENLTSYILMQNNGLMQK